MGGSWPARSIQSTRSRGRSRARSRTCRRWRGSASPAPPAARRTAACWWSSGVGSGPSWDATATRTAPISRRTARRRRTSCRSRWPARGVARDTSWRAGRAGPARYSGAARATRSAISRPRTNRSGPSTTRTRGRLPGATRRAASASGAGRRCRCRAASCRSRGRRSRAARPIRRHWRGPGAGAAVVPPAERVARGQAAQEARPPGGGQGAGAARRRPAGTGRATPRPAPGTD
jgi:hypothetical protein